MAIKRKLLATPKAPDGFQKEPNTEKAGASSKPEPEPKLEKTVWVSKPEPTLENALQVSERKLEARKPIARFL